MRVEGVPDPADDGEDDEKKQEEEEEPWTRSVNRSAEYGGRRTPAFHVGGGMYTAVVEW